MTFSHGIDDPNDPDLANVPFCLYETSGGVCNDDSCQFRHFRDIVLSGAWEDQEAVPLFPLSMRSILCSA